MPGCRICFSWPVMNRQGNILLAMTNSASIVSLPVCVQCQDPETEQTKCRSLIFFFIHEIRRMSVFRGLCPHLKPAMEYQKLHMCALVW